MIREVNLCTYLPEFMRIYKEPTAALEAKNSEFAVVWNATNKVLCNRFILTADEYGISRFEKILGIHPMEGEALEMRRMRVQNRWFNRIPYTMKMLIIKLAECLGEQYNFDIYADFRKTYEMAVIIYSSDDIQAEEVKYILNMMVPENIFVEIIYESVTTESTICFGTVMEQSDIIEIKQR